MKTIPLVAILVATLAAGGCASSSRPEAGDPPSTGRLGDMEAMAEGSGGGGPAAMRLSPDYGNPAPSVPVTSAHETAAIWMFPHDSDVGTYGEVITQADGYWIYTIAVPPRFTRTDGDRRALDLATLSNVELDDQGRLTIKPDTASEPGHEMVQGVRAMVGGLSRVPWQPGGQERTGKTTVTIEPRGGGSSSVQTTVQPQQVMRSDGTVDPRAMQDALDQARGQMRTIQGQSPQPAAGQGK